MFALRYVAAAAMLWLAHPTAAYWEYGHETVATIAFDHAAPRTRAAIGDLLRHQRDLATPTCPAGTIEQASVWADCIKTLGDRFSYASSWHYQNVDICKPFELKTPCRDGNCVSAQIDRNAKLLADRTLPQRERLMALAFLVHFVGDLHQPMHAGDRGDLGGNRVGMDYGIASGRINLHRVWDGYLAERAISTPPPGPAGVAADVSADEAGGTVEDWSRENWQIARDHAYATAYDGDPCRTTTGERVKLDDAEIAALVPVLRRQVARGGLRLARLLDAALGK